ncbi:hypothetical protein LTR17_025360 [Elasticomyces elasticus]|nr:hypothetical protein LTR17_025360 [Elasticomyces elasticus]
MEGFEDLIIDWIKTELPRVTQSATKDVATRRGLWRNSLFRLLVEARLTNAQNRNADGALQLFLDMLHERATSYRSALAALKPEVRRRSQDGSWEDMGLPMWYTMSLWPAIVVLCKHLGSGSYPWTDAKLYRQFLRYVEKVDYKGTEGQHQLALARLYLFQPDRPDTAYAIAFLKKCLGGKSQQQVREFLSQDKAIRGVFYSTLRNTVMVARRLGQHSEAGVLASILTEHFQDFKSAASNAMQVDFRRVQLDS